VFDEMSSTLTHEEKDLFNSIRTLIMVINAKDKYTYGHSLRLMELFKNLALRLGLNSQTVSNVSYGALLHDIGKIEIPREILNKHTRLSEEEWVILKQHPQWGADMIRPLSSIKGVKDIILYHHENLDGTGYPKGLKGEEIPIGARILRIADSYDAMTTNRPYKEALTKEQALEELVRYSGIYYDPVIVKEFINMMSEKTALIS
jgi:putative nucleotidyltransferase with HDIG domain